MIEVKNISKTYKAKQGICGALHNINIKFSNKGMVFIVGKSGSGKSTLLNLIGGIDFPTSGEILCNGQSIDKNRKTLERYRNGCIGFVFQDFCLIESMSVYDNIELASSINDKDKKENIIRVINDVGLTGKEDMPVNLLSGGQKQRVAIARALVKNPEVLLADEPTGNLDSKTSIQIFEMLKKLSKNKLVIVISHNLNEAYKYADRIIELSQGEVISDLDRSKIDEGNKEVAFLSNDSKISEKELKDINEQIKDYNIVISQRENLFKEHSDENENLENIDYVDKKIKFKKKWKLFKYFIRKKLLSMTITSVIIGVLIILMGLCQSYNNVNEDALLRDSIATDSSPLIFRKGYYDETEKILKSYYLGAVTDKDIETFEKAGYEGEICKLYRYPISLTANYDNMSRGLENGNISFNSGFYLSTSGFGVLGCSKEYLSSVYGVNGELVVLSGDLDLNPYGIVVTDYFADSLLNKQKTYVSKSEDKYELLINTSSPINSRYVINAVIDTNYEERYKEIIDQLNLAKEFPSQSQKIIRDLAKTDIAKEFIQEVKNYLGVAYSFNENFIEDSIEALGKVTNVHYLENPVISDENHQALSYSTVQFIAIDGALSCCKNMEINDGEIYITPKLYNTLYETELTYNDQTGFTEKEIYLDLYTSSRSFDDKVKFSKKFVIKGLINYSDSAGMMVSDNDFKELRSNDMSAYALYFSEGNNEESVYKIAESLYYKNSSPYVSAVQQICDITEIFKSIFEILLAGLVIATIIFLSSYVSKAIYTFKREIGIIRTMGGKSKDFAIPFIAILVIVGVIAAVLSSIGVYMVCDFVNGVVVRGFSIRLGITELSAMNLIYVSPLVLIYDLLLLFAVIIVCSLVSVMVIKKIKIVNILRRE